MPIRRDFAHSIQLCEVLGLEGVALDLSAASLGITGVEVEPMRAGQERQSFVEIGAKLVGGAGLAGIMARDGQSASQFLARVLEPSDVVALPAVQRDRYRREPRHGRFDVDVPRRVLFPRQCANACCELVSTAVMKASSVSSGKEQDGHPRSILTEREGSCHQAAG